MISVSSATHRRDLVLGCSKSKTMPDNGEKSKERHFPRESRTATAAASARGRMDCNGARSSFVSHKLASLLARGRGATGAAWARRRGGRGRERESAEREREGERVTNCSVLESANHTTPWRRQRLLSIFHRLRPAHSLLLLLYGRGRHSISFLTSHWSE